MMLPESRLCFCNSNIAWGGGEKWHLDAACSLRERDYTVQIIAHPDGALYPRARAQGIACTPFAINTRSFLNPFLHCQLKNFFQRQQISHLVLGLPADLKSAGSAAARAGVSVFYRRGSALPVRPSCVNRFLYSHVLTGLIVNSEQTRSLVQTCPPLLPAERIHLLYNGIDSPAFDQSRQQAVSLRQTLNIPESSLVLGNAGRLNRQKGQHYLLEMMPLLSTSLDIQLIIAGSGELEQSLKKQSQSLGLEDRVHFVGFLEDLQPFWKSIDIFVLSSLWEGFGYVLAEAMLSQKPVIAFDTSNMPELVHSGRVQTHDKPSGILVSFEPEHQRATALAQAVVELTASAEQRALMGQNGRADALKRFSQASCMDRLEQILGLHSRKTCF